MKTVYRLIRGIIAVLLCAAMALPGQAQNITKPKIACPNGLWVNSYNGVLFFTRVDAGMMNTVYPTQLQFYYNSSCTDQNYGYGMGFSMGDEMRYAETEKGIVVERGDGRKDLYVKNEQSYQAPAGVFDRLSQNSGVYTLRMKEGTEYQFGDNTTKKVTKITERNGFSTTLTYQADGMLTGISDAAGRTMRLEYRDSLLTRATASFLKGEVSYQYNNQKQLIKVTDPMGYAIVYGYDKQNHLSAVTDPNGNKTEISYTGSGAVSRVKTAVTDKVIRYEIANNRTVIVDYTQPAAQFSYYIWDKQGRVIEKSGLCCGIQEKLVYDTDDNVIQRTDANGHIRSFAYDTNGNMLTATDPEGQMETYTYEAQFNQVASYKDKNGNMYSFKYDNSGNLTGISGPEGFENRYTYNQYGAPLTIMDANGHVTQHEYDNAGLLISQTDAAGNTRRFTYDPCGNLLTSEDARQFITLYAYNARNELVRVTDALQGKTEFSYDKNGNAIRVKDAANRIIANTYDAEGNLLSAINPVGKSVTYKYNGKGKPIEIRDQAGNLTTLDYDQHDRVIRTTNPANEATSFAYDTKGNLLSTILPNGNTITYGYTMNDLVNEISDSKGIISKQTYDKNGNVLSQTDGENGSVSYQYDGLNRLIASIDPGNNKETYTYDKNSNRLSYINRNGDTETYVYNALNLLTETTDALSHITRFQYDGEGNLIAAIDAKSNKTAYTYDGIGRNTHITFANGTALEYAYDVMGNIIQQKNRDGAKIKFAYDALYQLVEKLYPDGTTDRYGYDDLGQLISTINKSATVTFSYDKAGRMTSETLNNQTTGYAYDLTNRTRTLTYPSGKQVKETMNVRDQIVEIQEDGTVVVNQKFNNAGQMIERAYNNGITTAYKYNTNGWLSEISDGKIMNVAMMYDKAGNILSRIDHLKPEWSEVYGYDKIQQITSFKRGAISNGSITNPTKTISYQYDALGNRTTVQEDGIATTYTANAMNEYTDIRGGLSFTPKYDQNGNMLNDQTHQYQYDYNNKLVKADENTGSYLYDGLGRRIGKTTKEGSIRYFYAGDDVIEERDGLNVLLTTYLIGNKIDDVLKMNRNEQEYFYHSNHSGSVMNMSDQLGGIQETYLYLPFGEVTFLDVGNTVIEVSAIGNNVLFTGRSYSAETHNYDYRTRLMNSHVGRFIQPDPLLYVDGTTLYGYVGNNPISFVDPLGLFAIKKRNMFGLRSEFSNNCNYGPGCYQNRFHEQIFFENGRTVGYGLTNKDRIKLVIAWDTQKMKDYKGNARIGLDDDIMERAIENLENSGEWGEGKYNVTKHNCQNFVDAALDEYKKLGGRFDETEKPCDFYPEPKNQFCKYYPQLCEDGFCDSNPEYCKMREADMALGKAWVNR